MTSPLLVVTGTGTGIGKTVVATGLVSAWASRGVAVAGIKPIESGQARPFGLPPAPAAEPQAGDVAELGRVSTFHVTRFTPPYLLADPVSPHLAARREGRVIDVDVICKWVASVRDEAEAVVLELAGGLFSPISDELTNADLLRAVAPSRTLLVAPDRLGVLHDVIATTRAATSTDLVIDGIVLSAPASPDASTSTNAEELARVLREPPVLAVLPRAARDVLEPHLLIVLERLSL